MAKEQISTENLLKSIKVELSKFLQEITIPMLTGKSLSFTKKGPGRKHFHVKARYIPRETEKQFRIRMGYEEI